MHNDRRNKSCFLTHSLALGLQKGLVTAITIKVLQAISCRLAVITISNQSAPAVSQHSRAELSADTELARPPSLCPGPRMDTPAPAPPHSLHSSEPVTSVLASVIGLRLRNTARARANTRTLTCARSHAHAHMRSQLWEKQRG